MKKKALGRMIVSVGALVAAAAFMFQQVLLGRPLVRDDAALFVYPQFRAMAAALRAGHMFLWDPQQWCGLPALATGQSGALYPLHLVLLRLLPWMTALHLCYWLHLALALVGMAWVARNLGMGWRAAVVGGVLYAFSGYSAAHLIHYNFIAAAAHLPLVLAVLQTALRRNEWRWWGLLGGEVALAFWVSHPQLFLMIGAVAGLWLVAGEWWKPDARRLVGMPQSGGESASAANGGPDDIRPLPERRQRRGIVLGLIAAAIIAALLMMPQLLPTLELARESRGIYAGEALGAKTFISSYPFRWIDLPRVLLPDLFGTAEANVIGGGPSFHETCAFVGVAGVLFGLVGLIAGWGRRAWWFAVLLVAVGVALMPAGNPIYLIIAKIPVLNSFRAMGRWAIVAIAGLSLLVSLGLDALPGASERRRAAATKLAWLLGGLLLFVLAALWVTFGAEGGALTLPGHPEQAIAVKNMAAAVYNSLIGWEPVFFVLGTLLALAAVQVMGAKRRLTSTGWALALAAVTLPLWYFWQVTNRPGPRDYYTASPATASAVHGGRATTLPPELVMKDNSWRQRPGPQDLDRQLLTPAYGTVFGVSYAEGYKQGLVTPSSLRFWDDYYRYGVQAFTGETTTTGETVARVGTPAERMKRFHKLCAAQYIVTPGEIADPDLEKVESGPVNVYRYRQPHPQAWLVGQAVIAADLEAQLQAVKQRSFDPYRAVVLDPTASVLGTREQAVLQSVVEGLGGAGEATVDEAPAALLRVRVDASAPAFLVVSQAWYPGWRAYVDGEPQALLRADYAIKAVPVGAGKHTVELRFEPDSWRKGLWLGGLGLLSVVLLMVLPRPRKRTDTSSGAAPHVIPD